MTSCLLSPDVFGSMVRPLPEPDDKTQLDKFKEAARQLETDDDEQRFKERLGKLVRVKTEKPE
jgi:hypothetical protein